MIFFSYYALKERKHLVSLLLDVVRYVNCCNDIGSLEKVFYYLFLVASKITVFKVETRTC